MRAIYVATKNSVKPKLAIKKSVANFKQDKRKEYI